MTLSLNYTKRTEAEVLEDLSIRRVPAVDELRRCDELNCNKILSRYNRHKTRCFYHQLSLAERELRREQPLGYPVCGSRTTKGFNYAQLMYHGQIE